VLTDIGPLRACSRKTAMRRVAVTFQTVSNSWCFQASTQKYNQTKRGLRQMSNEKKVLIVVENGTFPFQTEYFLVNNGYSCETKLNSNYKINDSNLILRSFEELKAWDVKDLIVRGLQNDFIITENSDEMHCYDCAKIMLPKMFLVPNELFILLRRLNDIDAIGEPSTIKPSTIYTNSDVVFNVLERLIIRNNYVLCQLTVTETKVLDLLIANANELTPRNVIETHLNYSQTHVPGRGLDMIVSSLRRRLRVIDPATRIEAVRCAGYRLLGAWTRETESVVAPQSLAEKETL
jgi:DNA-binding winged helix-turn-helix (wHTH) protein